MHLFYRRVGDVDSSLHKSCSEPDASNIYRSNLYVDGVLAVDNDYAQGTATQRCGSAETLSKGTHILYIEGWARGSGLSMAGTYKGPDTSMSFVAILPSPAPVISPVNLSFFAECDPVQITYVDGIFTLCGFKADNYTDITSVEDVYQYYQKVC